MRIAIHQPEYWPVPRLLAKWAAVDLLILLDITTFDRASLQHRCRMLPTVNAISEDRWLTIPYRHIGQPQQIRVVEPIDITWPKRHLAQIREWYLDANPDRLLAISDWFGANTAPNPDAIASVALYAWRSMEALVEWCRMGMPPVIWASALRPPDGGWGHKNDLVLNLCRAVRADTYLSGVRGSQYLDYSAFEQAGISIETQAFAHSSEFLGRSQVELSALHHYLVQGPEAVRIVVKAKGQAAMAARR